MWKRFAIAFVPAALFAIVGCDGASQKVEEPLAHTTKNRLLLVPAAKNAEKGSVRDIKLRDDGQSPLSEVTVLPDGAEKELFYKPDGSPSRVVEYFPLAGGGPRQLRTESVFVDGKTLQSHTKYRQDKTLQERGERLFDGTYEVSLYAADGKSLAKKRILAKDNSPATEETFNDKGQRLTSTSLEKLTNTVSSTTKHFDPANGNLLYRTYETVATSNTAYVSPYVKVETFYPGTETVRYSYSIHKDGTYGDIRFSNLNGEAVYEWHFGDKEMRFSALAPRKNVYESYTQHYKRSEKEVSKDSREWKFELDAVVDKDYRLAVEDEQRDAKRLQRMIEFAPGADTPYQLIINEGYSYSGERTIEHLNSEGKVVKQEVITQEYIEEEDPYDYDYMTGQKKKRTVSKDKSEIKVLEKPIDPEKPIDWSRMKFIPFELPPSFIEMPKFTIREIKH